MNDRSVGNLVRRKRSWYQRRLRVQRALIATALLLLLAAVCWQTAARFLALPTLHTSSFLPESFWTRGDVRSNLTLLSHTRAPHASPPGQGTYPYSVIPGGIRDAADLQEIAARDYVVRRHFAGFDYRHARLVRSGKAREAYLSYRIRDRVFWTRKRVRLLQAELLLTDGKITARARCGNRVSETPKPEVSEEEPEEDVLDQPVAEIDPIGPSLPFRFANVHPNLPGADAIPPGSPQLFAGGFFFPYVEFGVPIPKGICKPGDQGGGDDKKRCRHHHPPPLVPEPTTMVLISSGLAAVFWRYHRASRATAV
ncbi:MAG: PEP-CTERM sorting domain-containing protein [Acidobacteriales bacterium]|nr:PEP-CTERM sorting domain-containing protein [Terriglobales bacterium]